MAINIISVKCPECGANLNVEEGRKQLYCSFCGTKVMVQNENEFVYRHVDEAKIKQTEAETLLRIKELEAKGKEEERRIKELEFQEKENKKSRIAKLISLLIIALVIVSGPVIYYVACIKAQKYWHIDTEIVTFLIIAMYIVFAIVMRNINKTKNFLDEIKETQ